MNIRVLLLLLLLGGCETVYYDTMEKFGVHKRDILVDRVEDARDAQIDTQQEFRDALEQYRAVVSFKGGDVEKLYHRLNNAYRDSEAAAEKISDRIAEVENVADDLFDEWQEEAARIGNRTLRSDSQKKLRQTRGKYQQLITTMRRAEKRIYPVLDTLRDQTLYLKHNLNARAIGALKGELAVVNSDVGKLIQQMQLSIDEAEAFIDNIKP